MDRAGRKPSKFGAWCNNTSSFPSFLLSLQFQGFYFIVVGIPVRIRTRDSISMNELKFGYIYRNQVSYFP